MAPRNVNQVMWVFRLLYTKVEILVLNLSQLFIVSFLLYTMFRVRRRDCKDKTINKIIIS